MAAISVVSFHYCPHLGGVFDAVFASGPAAVGFFFLLSGFILALRHSEVRNRKSFWRARLIRIYPMYLVAFLLFAPIALIKYHHDSRTLAAGFALNLTMLQSWTNLSQSWNGPSWSLSVEAFLYAVFPLIVRPIGRRTNLVLWGSIAMVPAVLTIGFCNQWIPAAIWRSWIENNPLLWLPVFCFGVALGLSRGRSREPRRSMDSSICAGLLAIFILAVVWPPSYREVFVNGGAVLVIGALVTICTYRSPIMATVLGNSLMDRLGKASYITYIVQAPLWVYFRAVANFTTGHQFGFPDTNLLQFVIYLILLLAASLLLEAFVDEPVRRWLSGRKTVVMAAAVGAPQPVISAQ